MFDKSGGYDMIAGITERIVMNCENKLCYFLCFCIIWLLVLLTMKITHHDPIPKKKLIFLERNKASWLVDEKDWKDIVDSAEEIT